MNDIEKIIIIGGTGRCGTTWLTRWLLSHPDTFGPWGESNLLFTLANYATYNADYDQDNCFARVGINKKDYLSLAGDLCYRIYSDPKYNSNYELEHVKRKNQPFLIERTPANLMCWNEINEMMSYHADIYLLHIYRDGRNYLESAIRCNWDYMSWEAHADRWVNIMAKMINGDFNGKVLHIKYEDLVLNPVSSQNITKFCEITHNQDIVPFQRTFSKGIGFFDPYRWKTLLPNPQIEKCFDKMNPILEKLGYQ